ncbi:HNH endonuclease [Bacillus sp. es.036]|uniref:HNH endonuclease n=1 Tax=Bacillus sp. es.036 TaxID=1761764 RepID=UPI000C00B12E|nr:HNH endonuclease [Bacillus sp. es.036]PFG12304.1 HNH/ENDO VII superfamily nuclease [Bacillus sp. es.036]
MTRIAIKPEQLDQLASGIQDAERKADEAISDFKWNYQSLLMNITGANTGKIDALQAELQYEMRKYRDKLHDLQAAVKLTERKMTEEDRSLSAKFGLMALKFSGLNKLFQNYDPITGEALSWSDRLFGKNPLTASYDGVFGEMFPYLQHALNPQVIQSRVKQTYESVVLDPLSKTTAYLDEVRQDVSHSVVRYSSYVDRWWGETQQKVDEARNTARSFLGDVVKGVQVGSGNAVDDMIEGFKDLNALAEKAFGPNLALYRDEEDLPELLFKSLETINFYKNIFDDPKGNVRKVLDVPKYMWQGFKEAWDRDFVNGDAESRTAFITYGLTSLGIGAIGDKGLGKIGTTAKTIEDVADPSKNVKVDGKGAQPALAGAGAEGVSKGGAPYNVWNDPVSRIKTEIDRVYGEKGTGKGEKLDIQNISKEILEFKPMNSPKPDKWYKKGGSIFIDDNGVWTYTNKSGVSVRYPNGYPDFKPYMHPNVQPVKIEVYSPKNNPKDFENANKAAKLTIDTDPPIIDVRRPPEGYTWHHHQDGKTMMLVDEDIHREFRHIGGQSKINGKNK